MNRTQRAYEQYHASAEQVRKVKEFCLRNDIYPSSVLMAARYLKQRHAAHLLAADAQLKKKG
jgi:hypothetical protein